MKAFWLFMTISQYISTSLIFMIKGDVKIATIGLLIFYALNFWGCRIVELLKEQKND